MNIVIDIETENTGADIMVDNKRIISVQVGDSTKQELYYADAPSSSQSLSQVVHRVRSLISQNCVFVGYNIKGFDLIFLMQFLGIEIPDANVLELKDLDGVRKLQERTGRWTFRLEEVCREFGIATEHKRLMDERAEPIKKRQEIVVQATQAAKRLAVEKGWGFDFSLKYTLDKIAGGHAISDSYTEFVQKGGASNTLFYQYTVGDVICEHQLLQALLGNG